MNRQKVLLLILAVLFAAAVVYAYFRAPRQRTADKPKFTSGAPAEARRGEAAKSDAGKLHLQLLDGPMPHFAGYKRNIFWLGPLESKKRLPLPPPPPFKPPPPPPPPLPQAPQAQLPPARAEMAKFTFLGFLKKDNRKTIFLSKDTEIFVVRKGDRIANNYEVTSITDDVLTISPLSGGGQIVIPLVENMPLNVSAE